jgi:beta-xylosidase
MNVVLWADDTAGPWSDPINLNVYGLIDPGHVVDRQGNRFLYFNRGMVVPLTEDGLAAAGEVQKVYDGWQYPSEWVVECMCLEAPKLTYRNGFYYLVSAQGGTADPSTAHMAVVARATAPLGPWQNSPYNPLVRTQSRHEPWWRQGHGTLIDDPDGRWWLLYTGYEKGYTFLGKQSLLLPVEWTADGWPRIVPGATPTDVFHKPSGENVGHGMPLSEDFQQTGIGIQWTWSPDVDPDATFQVGEGKLCMQASSSSPITANALSVMPLNHAYEVTVKATRVGEAEGGLLVAPRSSAGVQRGQTFAKWPRVPSYVDWSKDSIWLRIRSDHGDVVCFYSADGAEWIKFDNSTRVANIRRVALYAAGEGAVVFERFTYRGLDEPVTSQREGTQGPNTPQRQNAPESRYPGAFFDFPRQLAA